MYKTSNSTTRFHPHRKHYLKYALSLLLTLITIYGLLAYIILPNWWRHYEQNPKLKKSPKTTQTVEGIPGDPLNIGLVGKREEVVRALLAAGWYPSDPVTLRSSIGIAASVVLKYPYPNAPVSNLYLWGRKQDLAFELPVGNNARERHHVRLWESPNLSNNNRPLWLGSVTFDKSVELSHLTGQITHHIDGNIDQERENLVDSLAKTKQIVSRYQVTGIGATFLGRNGGGDRYYTDGELDVCVLSVDNIVRTQPYYQSSSPEAVKIKNKIWLWLRKLQESN
jgi:hypothetical protein